MITTKAGWWRSGNVAYLVPLIVSGTWIGGVWHAGIFSFSQEKGFHQYVWEVSLVPRPPHLPVFDGWQYAKIPQAMKTGQWEGLGRRLAEVKVHTIPLVQVVVTYVTC